LEDKTRTSVAPEHAANAARVPGTDTLGRHLIAEFDGCDAGQLRTQARLRDAMIEAARRAGARVINDQFHHFGPDGGVSGVVLLAESHLSIHTWPEAGYAAVDIYTCGRHVRPDLACTFLGKALQARHVTLTELKRGEAPSPDMHVHEVVATQRRVLQTEPGPAAW